MQKFNKTLQREFADYNGDLLLTDLNLFNKKMVH